VARPFVVPTAQLFHHRGARQQVSLAGTVPGVALSTSRLTDDPVRAELTLEAQGSTVTVSGTVAASWTGECRRCLRTTGGDVEVELSEVFEPDPVEGETYSLGRDEIDVEPAIREALALALPLAPLCDETCAGPDPDDHPVTVEDGADEVGPGHANGDGAAAGGDEPDGEGAPADPRWAVLDVLRVDRPRGDA
jgi:uncharacterized protein